MMKPEPLIWQSLTINENNDFYEDIADDVEKWFDTMMKEEKEEIITYRKNKKVIGLMKDETGGKKLQNFQQIH